MSEYNPHEQIPIALTREQWDSVCLAIKNAADAAHASFIWWRDFCDDKRLGAETAAKYLRTVEKMDAMAKAIQDVLSPPPAQEKEE